MLADTLQSLLRVLLITRQPGPPLVQDVRCILVPSSPDKADGRLLIDITVRAELTFDEMECVARADRNDPTAQIYNLLQSALSRAFQRALRLVHKGT